MEKLLTRDEFRESVFRRDSHKCVLCSASSVDAHHILDRKLFPDDGYYLNNGASVCEACHILCEQTVISPEEVYRAANIKNPVLPPGFYPENHYDKWGNIILPNKLRIRGPMFHEQGAQKMLKEGNALQYFTNKIKYPSTPHLPWSESVFPDDFQLTSLNGFEGHRIIVTEKMDGENTTMGRDYIHARSLDSRHHASRDWVKAFWQTIRPEIPENWRICGENLYAKHSVEYEILKSYFYGFSIWNDDHFCLSWDDTLEWFELLNIIPVPVLYDGIWNEEKVKSLWDRSKRETSEGYVVRRADGFHYADFRYKMGKFVREKHVQSDEHWMHSEIIPNKLA